MGYFYIGEQGSLLLQGCTWTHRGVDTPTHNWKQIKPKDLWMKVMEEKHTVTFSRRQTGNPWSVFERIIWSRSSLCILKRFLPVRLKKFKPPPPWFCPLTVCTLWWSSWGGGANGETTLKTKLCSHVSCEWCWPLLLPCVTWHPAAFMKRMRTSGGFTWLN